MDIIKVFSEASKQWSITIRGTPEAPLFKANDIGVVLELTNIKKTLASPDFPADYKVITAIPSRGGEQQTLFLTTRGLYHMLFLSRKPMAKTFQRWVFDVIEEIRQTGKYEMDQRLLKLETENSLLKAKVEKKEDFVYAYKNDRREPNDRCQVKIGKTWDATQREATHGCSSAFGRMELVVRVPREHRDTVETLIKLLLKPTGTLVARENYLMNLDTAKLIVRLAADLVQIAAEDNHDALQHLVESSNWDLRGEGAPLPERPATTDVNGVCNMETLQTSLVAIQEELQSLKRVRSGSEDTIQDEVPPTVVLEDRRRKLPRTSGCPNADPQFQRAWDFPRFIQECCEVDPDAQEVGAAVMGRHRVWAQMTSIQLGHDLNDYLRTKFKAIRYSVAGAARHGFQGLRVLPVQRPQTAVPSRAELFLRACCEDASASRLFDSDMKEAYTAWRKCEDANFVESGSELRAVHKYLADCYYRENSMWRSEAKVSEAGYYGICLEGEAEKYMRRLPSRGCQTIIRRHPDTGDIHPGWEKVSEAAAALDISTSMVGYNIRKKKIIDGFLLEYGSTDT